MLFRFASIIYLAIALVIFMPLMHTAHADETSDHNAQAILHMLDYVSVDYGGSVLYGRVLNEREYKEQLEFAEQAVTLINKMPEHPSQAALIIQAAEIAKNVKEKSPANHVSELAEQLRKAFITTYHVPISPHQIPDTLPALALFQKLCVPCHGASGHGDGPLSKVVTPKPADFYNENRMEQRSVYGLYNSISLGVGRTAMTAFSQLSDEDRWSLAFLVSNFRTTPDEIEYGQKIWKARSFQGPAPDLAELTTTTENQILARYGAQTNAVFTYLRSEPQALKATPHATLIFATEQLDSAFNRYREGNKNAAQQLAISAYLDGFEPMEISLDNLDHLMRINIEGEMMNVRQLINSDMPIESVAKKIEQTKALLKQADQRVRQGDLSIVKVFTSAIFILMKESLGGFVVLAGLMAIVVKIGQQKARFYIYAGWGSASLLGGLTWAAATWMTELSGMSREITSAVTALISAAILSYFGLWLYNKTHWQSWQAFLHDQTDTQLRRRTLWVLALLSFFIAYRAAFESALFYEALWIQTTASVKPVIWSGMLTASLLLMLIAWVIFSVGMALSSKALFTSTSILLAVLSIVFAGQGVASLQKAGILTANKINFATIPLLGITPTTQGLSAQLVVITLLALGYFISIWRRNQ